LNISFFIAGRYLFAKKSQNIINIISVISLLGVSVATAALCIILSVFNGLQNFVSQSLNTLSPDIEITPKYGKIIREDACNIDQLSRIEGVEYIAGVLSDVAVCSYKEQQYVVQIKGVDADYQKMSRIDTITEGDFALQYEQFPLAILGAGVANKLGCFPSQIINNSITVYYPNRLQQQSALPNQNSLNMQHITPVGVFHSYTDFDNELVFVPIRFARALLGYEKGYTAIEIRCQSSLKKQDIQQKIQLSVGDRFHVKNAFEQEEELYKVMQSEKWITYAVLAFILLIASFNLIGMMAILILEKQQSVKILYCMGANVPFVRRIFIFEGLLISGIGLVLGLVIGLTFCLLQHIFGFVTFGGEAFLLKAYPVDVQIHDLLLICFIVMAIAFPCVYVLVRKLCPKLYLQR
jgi:ABC-type lipoprotein release transport system permease subunit